MTIERRDLYRTIENLERSEINSLKLKKLKRQLNYVYERSPFYKRLFDKVKLSPDQLITLDDIRRFPLIDKQMLLEDQNESPPYGHRLCVPKEKIMTTCLTSGTSGLGQEVYALTYSDYLFNGYCASVLFHRWGLKRGDIACHLIPLSTTAGSWVALEGYMRLGINFFQLGIYDTETKLKYMERFKPDFVATTGSYLLRITDLCYERGIDPKEFGVKVILSGGQCYSNSWCKKIEEIWGATMHEFYGSSQHGSYGAGTCEEGIVIGDQRGFMHFEETGTLWEIINPDTGLPVEPGEEGELVITNLNREGSPLIRFRTRDKVRFLSYRQCNCGRKTDGIEPGFISRYDDMLKIRGVNVWPEAVVKVVEEFKVIREHLGKVIITEDGKEQVILSVEFENKLADNTEEKLRCKLKLAEEIKRQIGISVDIQEAARGSIEVSPFKVRSWIDERKSNKEAIFYGSGKVENR